MSQSTIQMLAETHESRADRARGRHVAAARRVKAKRQSVN